jgi:hypothetical protein
MLRRWLTGKPQSEKDLIVGKVPIGRRGSIPEKSVFNNKTGESQDDRFAAVPISAAVLTA